MLSKYRSVLSVPGASRLFASALVGRAERLPLDDGSIDIVVFMRSFHHVPRAELGAALVEARRVIRPGGAVYVAEPLAEGSFFELTRTVDDETEVRAAAQAALSHASEAGLNRATTVDYHAPLTIAGLPGLRARIVAADPGRADRFDELAAELAEGLERLGEPGDRHGEWRFLHPMRADVLRPALG